MTGLEALSAMEYPGRFIILGKLETGQELVVYGVTGRSESSRARRFEQDKGIIRTAPTNPEVLKKGNPKLLIYNAIRKLDKNIVVSNGAQTDLIYDAIHSLDFDKSPAEIFASAFRNPCLVDGIDLTAFEPDEPNYTPRISGLLTPRGAGLAIAKHQNGRVLRTFFDFPLVPGRGKLIATYTGVNQNPLPSFAGEPLDIGIPFTGLQSLAQVFYDAIFPRAADKDFRVGVAVVSYDRTLDHISSSIVNRDGGSK